MIFNVFTETGPRGGAAGWGTALQVERSRVRFPMVSLEFFFDIDSVSDRNEYQEFFLEGKGGRCVGLTTLPSSCADCLEIWEPQPPITGLYRPVMGLLYLYRNHLHKKWSVTAWTTKRKTGQSGSIPGRDGISGFPGISLSEIKPWLISAFNLLKPTGHVVNQQFNIQQLYVLPTLYLCVLYLSENKQRLVPLTA